MEWKIGILLRWMEDINLLSLKPKQIYDEQLKLKKEKVVEKERLYIKGTFFANKVLFGFDDDVILQLCTDC